MYPRKYNSDHLVVRFLSATSTTHDLFLSFYQRIFLSTKHYISGNIPIHPFVSVIV